MDKQLSREEVLALAKQEGLNHVSAELMRQYGTYVGFSLSDLTKIVNAALLSQQVEAANAAQWVSVKDRLPEEGEVIFATGPKYNDYAKYGRYYATVQLINGMFYDEETGDDIYPPSHWMRIAAAPNSALSSPAEQKEGNV